MAKPPPKKPTDEFGQLNFDPTGWPRKIVERLPETKTGQEAEVGRRFAAALTLETQQTWCALPLQEEAGHDFLLVQSERKIEVQAVEIVAKRDFLVRIPPEAWRDKTHQFTSVVVFGPDDVWGVDLVRQRHVISDKIELKLSKNYSKPKLPLWLLVWTVFTGLSGAWPRGGKTTKVVSYARRQLDGKTPSPFDEIWMWSARNELLRIWPSDAPIEADLDTYAVTQTPANPGIYYPATALTLVQSKSDKGG